MEVRAAALAGHAEAADSLAAVAVCHVEAAGVADVKGGTI